MATCPFSGRRTDDAPPLSSGGGCPYSGGGAQPPARGLSRRSLLRFGLAALAAGPAFAGGRSQSFAAKTAATRTGPTPVPAAGKSIPIGGTPKWAHAVGNPRGSDIADAVGRAKEGRFGVMFKDLPAFAPPDDLLVQLANDMVDPRAPLKDVSDPTDGRDNYTIPAGYVYLGQFMDHDITRDTTPLSLQQQDPHALTNFDTAMFDLGSVYGGGPTKNPELYDKSKPGALLVTDMGYMWDQGGEAEMYDLPRQPDGTAIIGDPRNDENLIVSQLQVAYLRLHNRFIDSGMTFTQAQQQVRWHHQYVIVNDFLPRVVGQDLVDSLLQVNPGGTARSKGTYYRPLNPLRPMMPIEYSVAAYRFGHSMIRGEYEVHDQLTLPIFGQEGHDLRGSRAFPPDLRIDWNYFFELPGVAPPDDRNFSRLIDTQLSMPLASLPPTVVAPAADAITALAARNLLRGKMLGLPAGQDVARKMAVAPLSNADLGLTDARWGGKAPLWFYILKEAELLGGQQLGPVGGRIVAEVLLGLLTLRATTYFNATSGFKPVVADFKMGDLLQLSGAAPASASADARKSGSGGSGSSGGSADDGSNAFVQGAVAR
jgi:hypothetical protein